MIRIYRAENYRANRVCLRDAVEEVFKLLYHKQETLLYASDIFLSPVLKRILNLWSRKRKK